MSKNYTPEAMVTIRQLLSRGKSLAEIAQALPEHSVESVRAKVAYEKRIGNLLIDPSELSFEESLREDVLGNDIRVWNNHRTIERPNAVICSDFHIPFVNVEVLDQVISAGERYNIPTCIIVGDFFSLEVFSYWDGSPDHRLKDEMYVAERVLYRLFDAFDEIWIIPGNHEQRYWRKLDAQERFFPLFNYILSHMRNPDASPQFHLSMFSYLDLDDGISDYKWHLTHQKNYSKVPLSVPKVLSRKITDKHILCAHTHAIGMAKAEDGNRVIGELGCVTKAEYFDYMKQRDTSSGGSWCPGFFVIKNGKATVISEYMGVE